MNPVEATTTALPCTVCGSSLYRWGWLGAHGISFTSDDAPMLKKLFQVATSLRARCCNECGNLQLFAEPAKRTESPPGVLGG